MLFKFKNTLQILFAFISLAISSSLFADIDELYNLSIGTNVSSFDSEISINAQSGKYIELENALGFDEQVTVGWISAWYRVGDQHRIRLTYTPIRRDSIKEITEDITLDNTTIKAGAQLVSRSKSDILDFSYIYSFYKTPKLEAGFSAGIYWLFTDTNIVAAGLVIADGETTPTFQTNVATEQKIQAPMPLIGLSVNYEFSPSWRSHAALRALTLQLNEIDGSIFSLEAGTEYFFNKNWGIGASISTFDLTVDVTGLISNSTFGWAHSGAQIYAVFKY